MITSTESILVQGFPTAQAHLIFAVEGGSRLHGVKLPGTDDTDLYGIYIEAPYHTIWQPFEHFVHSTSPQEQRNVASDVDVTCYSLRKFAHLALAGNPTILHLMFAHGGDATSEWCHLLAHRTHFLGKSQAKKYLGYADAQLHRMIGDKGRGKHGQRPELEQQHGYDTKAATHTLRLLLEGIELMDVGYVTLPRPADQREMLLEVRKGTWSVDRVIVEANRLFTRCKESAAKSFLPDEPNVAFVSALVVQMYLNHWRSHDYA